ncbi:unnamed protein product [Arabis nemorensis]|uniref:FBD domain-containing protein n=1 Tax=Arabis nemorensis TaxID=586526 RepID=A0A565AXU3_9BRAS|nr:unnamed protein product [Arabis nemorensis]
MSESPDKKMKPTEDLHEDTVEHILSTFLPIQSFLRSRMVSKRFRNTEIRCKDLDFSGLYSVRRRQLKVVQIIESVFNQHKGSEINRFVLIINHTGVEDKILSWINTCLVTKDMIDAIFKNCIYLETLELIKCGMNEVLSINARNHKKFKSLVVYSMPKVWHIVLDAPTLECYKYDGPVRAPTICSLFDIAEFLKQCPKLEKVLIDISDFTFEPTGYWDLHLKVGIQKDYKEYDLTSIKEVEINGYKSHWHELDIVEFFVLNARSLEHLILKSPRNRKSKRFQTDERRMSYIKSISPKKYLIKFIKG